MVQGLDVFFKNQIFKNNKKCYQHVTTSVEVAKYAQGHFRYFLFNKSHCAKIASRVAADLCTCAIWFLKACWKTTFYWICGYFRNLASDRKKFFIKTSPFHKRNISAKYFFRTSEIFSHTKHCKTKYCGKKLPIPKM